MLRRHLVLLSAILVVLVSHPIASHLRLDEKSVRESLGKLRSLEEPERGSLTKSLAFEIRSLPGGASKTGLASGLATLCTESDSGKETLQAVADTLAQAVQQSPPKAQGTEPAYAYVQLAQFSRYEKLKVSLEAPEFKAAVSHLIALEKSRDNANFTLKDLAGKEWTLKSIKGKVVLVNFWATWCPPCRKEMPDMEKIYQRFKDKGLVILAISDEEESKVRPFIEEKGYTFPILLDPGRKANTAFGIQGIPNSFVFDRFGRLQAVAIDGRSERQLLDLLAKAGLK